MENREATALPEGQSYAPGAVVGDKYRLLRRVGSGGAAEVWEAVNLALDAPVAIKLFARGASRPRAASRFLQEARAAARLDHPAIVRVFDFGQTPEGDPFIVMELLRGVDAAEHFRVNGALQPSSALRMLLPIAEALAYAHTRGTVHLDLKPANIFLASLESGRVQPKIVDFGLAKKRDGTGAITLEGAIVGTPLYMSPEQVEEGRVDHRADTWSFCVVLYEALTNRPAFQSKSEFGILRAIVETEPPPLAIDPVLAAAIARGLDKDPRERWPTLRDLGRELAAWLLEQGVRDDLAGSALRTTWFPEQARSSTAPWTPPVGAGFEPGVVIDGKYRVDRVLAEGGAGVVTLATQLQLDRPVAIKHLRKEMLGDAATAEAFEREARLAAQIRSEHVVRIHDVGTLGKAGPYMVMEFLEGNDLGELLERGALPADLAVDYVMQACDALAEAHALGIVHRDIKPDNLFLAKRPGHPSIIKVIDFGISKMTPRRGKDGAWTVGAHQQIGTPVFMSPEQLKRGTVDARTDIWALGVVLHELMTGSLPFSGDTIQKQATSVLKQEPVPLRAARPDLPPALEAAVLGCLAKDPARRFQDIQSLRRAIAPFARPTVAEPVGTRPPPEDDAFVALPPARSRSAQTVVAGKISSSPPAPIARRSSMKTALVIFAAIVGAFAGVGLTVRLVGTRSPAVPEATPSATEPASMQTEAPAANAPSPSIPPTGATAAASVDVPASQAPPALSAKPAKGRPRASAPAVIPPPATPPAMATAAPTANPNPRAGFGERQ